MNINHSYNASKLQNDISNMALVSTTFVNTWNNLAGERFSQDSRDLAKAGRDLYQHAKEYFEAANKIIKNSNTLQSQIRDWGILLKNQERKYLNKHLKMPTKLQKQ